MKRMGRSILAIFFPWIVLLMYDNPGGAFITMVMQATLIGWIPASIWAFKVMNEKTPKTKDKNNT